MSLFIYSIRRLLAMIPLVVGISIMNFIIYAFTPVDPVNTFIGLNRELLGQRDNIRAEWGLNKTIYERYLDWAIPMFTKLDFGKSWHGRAPVKGFILPMVEKTVLLFGFAFFLTILVSTIMGIVAAVNHNSIFDQSTLFGTLVGFSIPSFVLGIVIIIGVMAINIDYTPIYIGADHKKVLAPIDEGGYWHVILAATMTIVIGGTAFLTRLVRSQMLDVLRENYVRTARAKGLPERVVIYKHALRNALLPFVTVVALSLPGILGGSAIIELVFNYPGVGRQIVRSALLFDIPVLLAINMFFGTMSILMLLVAEIIYAVVDPRIKF